MPAAVASGLPLSVPAWYTAPEGASCVISSPRPPNAASGSPPPTILPSTVRSGTTPKRSWAPPRATRNPPGEDEPRPGRAAEQPQRLQKARRRRAAAHVPGDRLDEDRGQPLPVPLDRRGDAVDVVVVAHDRVGGHPGRNTGRARDAE